VMARKIFGKEYTTLSSSLCNFLRSPVAWDSDILSCFFWRLITGENIGLG
jgi:hypothetical protein